jgi:hypothetical protein
MDTIAFDNLKIPYQLPNIESRKVVVIGFHG